MLAGLLALIAPLAHPGEARAQWPPDTLQNLQVLPQDIDTRALIGMMAGFTRALGVRCQFCHVGEEGMPLSRFDFASDDKETKRKARVMIRMVQHINGEHLAELESRSEPAVEVTCGTCHRGVPRPRTLQDVLIEAYDAGGLDSAVPRYHGLRHRYYGRASYDFGEVPLDDVAQDVAQRGALADAVALLQLNLEQNPGSVFAQRRYVDRAIELAFLEGGTAAGTARYRELAQTHAPQVFPEFLLNALGYRLLGSQRLDEAVAVFELNVEAYPNAFNTHDSLGEAYIVRGDTAQAIVSYEKSLELNPQNTNAAQMLERLRGDTDGGR
jgi:hypothetical protein